MSEAADTERLVRGSRWSDDQSREALESIIETIAEVAGFDVVGVSAVREDGYLHGLCVVGSDDAKEVLVDTLAPVGPLLEALAAAEDWGWLKYIRHDRHRFDLDRWGWIADMSRADVPVGTWHPEDLLVAPLYDGDGRLLGILGLDMPRDGLVPDESKRAMVDAAARQACRAVVATLERERLNEQVRLTRAAADIVRRASSSMAVTEVLAECGTAIVEGFRAQALWTQLLGEEPRAVRDEAPVPPPPAIEALLARYAESAWSLQDVGVFAPDRAAPASLADEERDAMLDFLSETNAESLLVVPLGAGTECLGWIGLSRGPGGAEWSDVEAGVALDIGRDLGRALATARNYEREHQLVEELQQVADYKGHLIATVSHELRTPLTSIVGYLEILAGDPGLSERSLTAIAAIQRGSTRLSRVVEELLVLHRTTDSELDDAGVVDLAPIVADIAEINTGPAESRGIEVTVALPGGRAPVLGVGHELEHVVANLIGNAVKYTPDDGRVSVYLDVVGDEVVLTCTDDGIGISETDQAHVFEEFYRSADPDAVIRSGTGLGLAIVRRVVDRHGGRIELESELGAGSTFRVRLPAAVSPPGS